ncbi:hypothetical protein NT26_0977 [Pseudorhizobium banfieldiae]|uniref:Uncharacterized protein n=1 Tax=Pseudorhizobium banfieldiae TaxID=1125847 RepID=L0ND28_9HYPH|nr:hypothetical protein NT26_0977 [Pseudorhizobium banfieldiae]
MPSNPQSIGSEVRCHTGLKPVSTENVNFLVFGVFSYAGDSC